MRQEDVLVKWTGSKRVQAASIVGCLPERIETYHEPFLGGGSVLFELISSDVSVSRYECGDTNPSLIGVWRLVKESPEELLESYCSRWPFDAAKYTAARSEFNATKDPKLFFCLLRSCHNGLVRYNLKGEFTSAFHQKRRGIKPESLRKIVTDWHDKLVRANVNFFCRDYHTINTSAEDFCYLDPPYGSKEEFYSGKFDYERLWEWMGRQKCGYALSMAGVEVPRNLYESRERLPAGFHRMNRPGRLEVSDEFYTKLLVTSSLPEPGPAR